MATSEILPFAHDSGANVTSQSDYAAATTLLADGFRSGTAESAKVNKVLRQSSLVAAAVAKAIANAGINVVDDGDYSGLADDFAAIFVTGKTLADDGYLALGPLFGNIIIRWKSITIPALTAYTWDYSDFSNAVLFAGVSRKNANDSETVSISATTSSAVVDNYPGSATTDVYAFVVGY